MSGFATAFLHPPLGEPLFQHLCGATGCAIGTVDRTAVRQVLPLYAFHRGNLTAPAGTAGHGRLFAQFLGDAITLCLWSARAYDDFVALAFRACIVTVNDKSSGVSSRPTRGSTTKGRIGSIPSFPCMNRGCPNPRLVGFKTPTGIRNRQGCAGPLPCCCAAFSSAFTRASISSLSA